MNTAKTLMETLTPQEQAEAMALAFKLRDFLPEHVIEYMSTEEEDAFVASISTTLSKLIAENERLKKAKDCECGWEAAKDWEAEAEAKALVISNLQSQLTATEAKLEIGRKWMDHSEYCQSQGEWKPCSCGLSAFLSTLTAEKKETTMNNRTISVNELQCVCGNVQNILIKIPTNIRIAVCSACHNEWPIGAVIETAEKKEQG